MSKSRSDSLKVGSISPWGIVFMVLATAAPLTAMATALPLVVGFGSGVGAPGTFLLVAVVLALFAVGYSAMSAHIVNAGAFYAYISAGLGRRLGMASGLVAVVAYNVLTIYVVGLIGYFAKQTFDTELGLDLPWWLYSAVALGMAVTLGIRGLEVNVRTLGIILIVETGLLVVFDVVALLRNGFGSLPVESFKPSEVFSGSPGLALLFAVTCFIGFEATAIFGEEARDPHTTVPRATYMAIGLIGTLYVFTAWVLVGTNGGTNAGEIAAADPGTFTFDAMSSVLGSGSTRVANWLLLSSLLAVLMALHNMSSRYLMAFGREQILPRWLAHTHPVHQTPRNAGITQAVIVAVVAGTYAIVGADPYVDLGSQTAGFGSLSIILLMAMCSFSVPFYFRGRGPLRPWHHVVAPIAAGLALSYFAYLIVDNYAVVTGSTSDIVNRLPFLILVIAAIGFVIGARQQKPAILDAVAADTTSDVS